MPVIVSQAKAPSVEQQKKLAQTPSGLSESSLNTSLGVTQICMSCTTAYCGNSCNFNCASPCHHSDGGVKSPYTKA